MTVKRQRKLLEEDLPERPDSKQLEEAYAESMMQRLLVATSKQPKKKFVTGEFRRAVMDYYGAAAEVNGIQMLHCPLAGWVVPEDVKFAHIVPKILSSEELSHLYGVGDLPLRDPKNGTLVRIVSLVES